MELKPVNSSNIAAVGYDGGTMHVQFANGSLYKYEGVTEKDYADLMNADSIGSAFHFGIKQKYEATRVDPNK